MSKCVTTNIASIPLYYCKLTDKICFLLLLFFMIFACEDVWKTILSGYEALREQYSVDFETFTKSMFFWLQIGQPVTHPPIRQCKLSGTPSIPMVGILRQHSFTLQSSLKIWFFLKKRIIFIDFYYHKLFRNLNNNFIFMYFFRGTLQNLWKGRAATQKLFWWIHKNIDKKYLFTLKHCAKF